jgi:hypothetical protein
MLYLTESSASDASIEAEISKSRIEAQSWRRVGLSDVPTDRLFRASWRDTGTAIENDMEKARKIWLDEARRQRQPKLDDLDREWSRAMGQNKKKEADDIEVERQRLRDLPETIADAVAEAKDLVELRAVSIE